MQINQDAYYQELEFKRQYYLIEYQRCVLTKYSQQRNVYIQQEEKRLRKALLINVVIIGLGIWYCFF